MNRAPKKINEAFLRRIMFGVSAVPRGAEVNACEYYHEVVNARRAGDIILYSPTDEELSRHYVAMRHLITYKESAM